MLLRVADLTRYLGDRVVLLAAHQARSRLYAELLRMLREQASPTDPSAIVSPPSVTALATIISTGRSNASKCLKDLSDHGIIERDSENKLLRILEPEALELLLEEAERGNADAD
jgi:DNA-binding IclR family transcriptional regulator